MVPRRQLERLLEIGQKRSAEIQALPPDREDNAGPGGPFCPPRLQEGTTVVHNEVQWTSRLIPERRGIRILEPRHGVIRAQALPPRESPPFVEKALGET